MFTWKRLSIVLSFMAAGILGMHISDSPRVEAQIKPAMVRSVDEPARVPYLVSARPTCPFVNECTLTGTTVPAGKRLRITRIEGSLLNQNSPGSVFVALFLNSTQQTALVSFNADSVNGAFHGSIAGFNRDVDYFFEAGQTPLLEIGVGGVIDLSTDPRNSLSLVGYLVDTQP